MVHKTWGGEFFPPLLNNLKLRPKRAIWDFQTLWLLTLAYCAHFCQFLCYPFQYFLIYDFFSKLCQTKIAIFRDFLIYNDRDKKMNFSVENYHNIMKFDVHFQFNVNFKFLKFFEKFEFFSCIHAFTQFLIHSFSEFLKFLPYFTLT